MRTVQVHRLGGAIEFCTLNVRQQAIVEQVLAYGDMLSQPYSGSMEFHFPQLGRCDSDNIKAKVVWHLQNGENLLG